MYITESKVSILIPVYNVSNYIEHCAHSIFSQTFQDIEFIFVDDCTPDDSISIIKKVLEKYPQRKSQVKFIHHTENKGIGATRNSAFKASSGKYILYIDSDDYIEKEMVELLYDKIQTDMAEIAVCDFFVEQAKGSKIIVDNIYESKEKNLQCVIEAKNSLSSLVNKLITAELFSRCKMIPDGLNYGEDRLLMMQLYFYAKKIVKVNRPLYHYVNNTHSISHSISERHYENTLLRWRLIEEFYIEHNVYEKYKDIIGFTKIKSKGELLINTTESDLRKKYADMFLTEEIEFAGSQTPDKKIILFLVRKRMFTLAQIFCKMLNLYNRKIKKLRY
jgi:glycosyltransferase involved in cell wall biosynthesis